MIWQNFLENSFLLWPLVCVFSTSSLLALSICLQSFGPFHISQLFCKGPLSLSLVVENITLHLYLFLIILSIFLNIINLKIIFQWDVIEMNTHPHASCFSLSFPQYLCTSLHRWSTCQREIRGRASSSKLGATLVIPVECPGEGKEEAEIPVTSWTSVGLWFWFLWSPLFCGCLGVLPGI